MKVLAISFKRRLKFGNSVDLAGVNKLNSNVPVSRNYVGTGRLTRIHGIICGTKNNSPYSSYRSGPHTCMLRHIAIWQRFWDELLRRLPSPSL